MPKTQEKHRHIIACLVDNEFGVLARVIGLFSGRGYNIESLTVAEVDHNKSLSRITIVTSGSDMVIEQIKALLERIIPVHKVVDLTVAGEHVERELALVKVVAKNNHKIRALKIADDYKARLIDSDGDLLVIEATGTPNKIDEYLAELKDVGLVESCRTGSIAISRNYDVMKAD